ncbi:TRAP transporter small permease [Clostridium phoceensis]|uniref:TRAP transporter small permease n=1 Tax=Clostridium phoceensis TaxID=1650661 RepID=UPI00067F6F10|nr:TRAP transporter small permease subunit [Clostridium phoceensis]
MFNKFFDKFEEYAIAALVIIGTAVVIFQAIIKYLIPDAAKAAEEISQYLYSYLSFFTLGYCMKYSCDLTVSLIHYKGRLQKLLNTAILVFCGVIYAILLWGAIQAFITASGAGSASGIPLRFVGFSAVLGYTIGLLRMIQKMIQKWNNKN